MGRCMWMNLVAIFWPENGLVAFACEPNAFNFLLLGTSIFYSDFVCLLPQAVERPYIPRPRKGVNFNKHHKANFYIFHSFFLASVNQFKLKFF